MNLVYLGNIIEDLANQTNTDKDEIINLLTGYCWDEEEGFNLKEYLDL